MEQPDGCEPGGDGALPSGDVSGGGKPAGEQRLPRSPYRAALYGEFVDSCLGSLDRESGSLDRVGQHRA